MTIKIHTSEKNGHHKASPLGHLRKWEALTLRAWHSLIGRSNGINLSVYHKFKVFMGRVAYTPNMAIFRAESDTIGPHPISLRQATHEPGPRTLACPHR